MLKPAILNLSRSEAPLGRMQNASSQLSLFCGIPKTRSAVLPLQRSPITAGRWVSKSLHAFCILHLLSVFISLLAPIAVLTLCGHVKGSRGTPRCCGTLLENHWFAQIRVISSDTPAPARAPNQVACSVHTGDQLLALLLNQRENKGPNGSGSLGGCPGELNTVRVLVQGDATMLLCSACCSRPSRDLPGAVSPRSLRPGGE